MTATNYQTAVWTPGWYELDQSLMLGERQKYWFFQTPPETADRNCANAAEPFDLVFYNQLDSTQNCCVRYAKVVEMIHPKLGPLLRIDTDGLDYIFYPVDGEEIIVNAEEEPGTIYDHEAGQNISDWSVFVRLAEVSAPTEELA